MGASSEQADLFEWACNNGPRIESRFARRLNELGSNDGKELQALADQVALEGRVSVNFRPQILLQFLNMGEHLNIWEWAERESERREIPAEELVKAKLGRWYPLRIRFEGRFVGARSWHYGALNIGGVGPHRYGTFCSVMSKGFRAGKDTLAFLLAIPMKVVNDD